MELAELYVWWFGKLCIGYAFMKIFVHFTSFKNNADISAYAALRVKGQLKWKNYYK